MAETVPIKDSLEKFRNDPEAIRLIMTLYGADEALATDVWHKMMGTIEKLYTIAHPVKEVGNGNG